MTDQIIPTDADKELTAFILGYADWDAACDYRNSGAMDATRERVLKAVSAHRVQSTKELRETLEFYADRQCDGYEVHLQDYVLSTENGEIIKDGGAKARAALGE